jgi:hypothetical protein
MHPKPSSHSGRIVDKPEVIDGLRGQVLVIPITGHPGPSSESQDKTRLFQRPRMFSTVTPDEPFVYILVWRFDTQVSLKSLHGTLVSTNQTVPWGVQIIDQSDANREHDREKHQI